MNFKKKLKKINFSTFKYKTIITSILVIFILSNFTGIALSIPNLSQGQTPEFLYEKYITQNEYRFMAKGKCYLIIEVQNTDFVTIELDGEIYTDLSFGLNNFYLEFSDVFEEHVLKLLSPQSTFKSITCQPIILSEGIIEANLTNRQRIDFKAGGLISILLQPDFLYNYLHVDLDGHILKKMFDIQNYPEIDSQLYSFFVEGGEFLRFDFNVDPGDHHLWLKGNGDVEYKIVTNYDWDDDDLGDVDEFQLADVYNVDPGVPDLWGYFQKSEESILWSETEEEFEFKEGHFDFYVPDGGTHFLTFEIYNGNFTNLDVDGDSLSFQNIWLSADHPKTEMTIYMYPFFDEGWHYVEYDYLAGQLSKIQFRVDSVIVKNIKSSTLLDSDGDGIKDLEEQAQYHDVNKLDSDDDGLPDAYDSSPSSSLMLDNNGMLQAIFDADYNENSIVTINVQKPLHDYSTKGIPKLWRNMYNVSITPVLRLFGNKYTEDAEIGEQNLDRSNLYRLWGKNIATISTLDRSYDIDGIGDPLPSSQPNSELWFIFPRPAEESMEFEFNFPRFHPAKIDNALDLRFDFIWLVTYYNSTDGSTNILHYYDFEDDILIQSIILKEMGNVDYKIASPENFIENQIIWALTQNTDLEIPQGSDIQDKIIGEGNIQYNNLNEAIITDLSNYYETDPPKGNEIVYLAALQDNYDILQKIVIRNGQEDDESKFTEGDYQAYLSFYTISNVYETEDYNFGDPQIKGEQKVVYQNTFTGFTTISGMPIDIDFNSYSTSDVLTIIEALSEPIPSNLVPYSLGGQLHEKVILHHETYIEKHELAGGEIPRLNFNPETDIYKEFVDIRAREVDQGDLFFDDSLYQSRSSAFESQLDQYRDVLEELHDELSYFTTPDGQYYYPGQLWDPLRQYSTFLDTFKDDDGEYFRGFLSLDPNTKLNDLYDLERELPNMVEGMNLYDRYDIVPDEEDPAKPSSDLIKHINKATKEIKDVHNVAKYKLQLSKMYGSGAYNMLYKGAPTKFKPTLKQKLSLGAKRFGNGMKTVIGVSAAIVLGVIAFSAALADLGRIIANQKAGVYDNKTVEFYSRFAIGLCELTIGVISMLNGVIRALKQYTELGAKTLPKAIKFLGKLMIVLAIVIEILQWAVFISKVVSGELSESEFYYELTKLAIQSTATLIGLGIAAAVSTTGIGVVVGVVIAALSILTSWLTPLFNHPSLKLHQTKISFPDATTMNMRRHGSLEINDQVKFYLKVQNDGDRPGWVRARFRVQETASSGWTGNWGWAGAGDWADNIWPWNLWGSGNYFEYTFTSQIAGPSTNLHFNFELQFDWEKFEIIIVWPVWSRQTGARESTVDYFNMPVLQNTISAFDADTTKLVTAQLLKDEFDRALEDYQYKDAYNIANQIIKATEAVANTDSSEILDIINNMEDLNEIHYFYHFSLVDALKFSDFIYRFYEEGVRARNVIPDWIWWGIRHLGDKIRHMLSYLFADGDVIFPKTWIETKALELGDAVTYTLLRNQLPLKTNIRVDLRENMIDIDPYTKTAEVSVPLFLEGPDGNEIVNIEIIAPDGFSITPNNINQPLKQDISFTITQLNHSLIMNVFFFEMIIGYDGKIVYNESVPFRLKPFSLLIFEETVPTEPLIPGEYYSFFTIEQLGTIPDTVEFLVDGIPEEFIYKDLYSPESVFSIYPGESRPLLVINPPKHYSTIPGNYDFNVTARDPIYNKTHYTYAGSFKVEVFHGLSFNCTTHDVTIYDYQTAVYECEIMNLGNVIEEFEVTFTDVGFADSFITSDAFILDPGEYATFNIIMDPFELGSQPFTITVASVGSEFLSKEIIASLTVIDDDILDPWFENLLITDNCNWLNISFDGLDIPQGDDMGLSLIEIYVDGELVHSYLPSPSQTSFNFELVNDWIWEVPEEYYTNGFMTHDIRVRIVDADEDRTDDELVAEVLETFDVTLEEMYNYVIYLAGEVNNYIYDNSIVALFGVFTQKIIKIQNLLLDAYQLVQDGYLHTGLVRNKMAEIKLEIADTKMELMINKQSMSILHFEHLKDCIQNVRNKIVELMGLSVGTELGHKLSLQEVKLYNLRDVVEEKIIIEQDRENLVNIISLASSKLENAIFDISLDKNTEASIVQAINAVSHATAEVLSLANKGKITEELKFELLTYIISIQAQLIIIMNTLI